MESSSDFKKTERKRKSNYNQITQKIDTAFEKC